jgi:hypothetical protein
MARAVKQRKEIFFVCSAIKHSQLLQRTISGSTFSAVRKIFEGSEGIKPIIISGPFFKKRGFDQECFEDLKFSGISKKAIYEDWEVTAQILLEPENTAYLFFKKRIDGQNVQPPDGHVIVDIQNLRFI